MISIFEFLDYRQYLKAYFKNLPKNGHGQLRLMAKWARIHTTYLSQVLKGPKNFNQEQAIEISEYLKLTPLETKYLILLIDLERSGTTKLKDYIRSQLFLVKEESLRLSARLNKESIIDEKVQTIFYSKWQHSAVRIATSLPHLQNRSALTRYFNLDPEELERIISFLVKFDLCAQHGEKIIMGPQRTHLASDSPLVSKHHINWRLRAFENYNQMKKSDLSFTGPLSLSKQDAIAVREKLMALIQDLSERVKSSNPECLHCLNIDWFGF